MPGPATSYWRMGLGPASSRQLDSSNLLAGTPLEKRHVPSRSHSRTLPTFGEGRIPGFLLKKLFSSVVCLSVAVEVPVPAPEDLAGFKSGIADDQEFLSRCRL